LSQHFGVRGIPSLVLLDMIKGELITLQGTQAVRNDPYLFNLPWPAQAQATKVKPPPAAIETPTVLLFDKANYEGIIKKIRQFAADNNTPDEASQLIAIAEALGASETAAVEITSGNVGAFATLLEKWPAESSFPVLDLARAVIVRSTDSLSIFASNSLFRTRVLSLASHITKSASRMALRFLANALAVAWKTKAETSFTLAEILGVASNSTSVGDILKDTASVVGLSALILNLAIRESSQRNWTIGDAENWVSLALRVSKAPEIDKESSRQLWTAIGVCCNQFGARMSTSVKDLIQTSVKNAKGDGVDEICEFLKAMKW
jgi:hypothetical protein